MRSRILLLKKITLTCSHRVGFPLSKTSLEPDMIEEQKKSSILSVHLREKNRSLSPQSAQHGISQLAPPEWTKTM